MFVEKVRWTSTRKSVELDLSEVADVSLEQFIVNKIVQRENELI